MSAKTKPFLQDDKSYSQETLQPLYCLVFVIPMLVFFHVGTYGHRVNSLVLSFFDGPTAYLPPMAIISVLLGQHLFRKDRWEIRLRVLGGMFVESTIWLLPLLAISHVAGIISLTATTQPAPETFFNSLMLAIGSGIYEEFIFRLLAIGIIMLILIDILSLPKVPVVLFAVVITAVIFALSHLKGPPYTLEMLSSYDFIFRVCSGLTLGACFTLRGFGIAAGTHVMWNIYVFVM
ncbi:MAG: CPBP family intramembrane metalloprotease [bacterium]|nr:CPBP family intramembrane metalloprotease [bacterium]